MGIIRWIKNNGHNKDEEDSGLVKLLQEDILTDVQEVLKNYAGVFPEDLPPSLPPVRMGHEFCIDLEDDTPPMHRPLTEIGRSKETDPVYDGPLLYPTF